MPIENIWRNKPDEEGNLPGCQFYVSIDKPECGKPSKWGVLVEGTGSTTRVTVDLCDQHKAEYDEARRNIAENNRRRARQRLRSK